ncbi:hypothetical protein DFR28_104286 [Arenicella xantha]|uniref:Uncharacterized protein n=1 Tax=Arenicella xantha TaxID=644221 RepID=A0A395JHP1_9GAMM|nr:hypothetical protein DFR28_104286 [Arenicella xantha]
MQRIKARGDSKGAIIRLGYTSYFIKKPDLQGIGAHKVRVQPAGQNTLSCYVTIFKLHGKSIIFPIWSFYIDIEFATERFDILFK